MKNYKDYFDAKKKWLTKNKGDAPNFDTYPKPEDFGYTKEEIAAYLKKLNKKT